MRNESIYSKMTLEPLRSALAIGEVGETSLALPSDRSSRSAQQRVLEQVSTMKRTKSKYGSKSGPASLSPTSPQSDSVFYEYKFFPNTQNGMSFMNESSVSNGQAKVGMKKHSFKQRSISTRNSTYQRNTSNSMLQSPPPLIQPRSQPDGFMPSRSVPDLGSPTTINGGSVRYNQIHKQTSRIESKSSQQAIASASQVMGNGTMQRNVTSNQFDMSQTLGRRPPSTHSNPELKISAATRSRSEINGANGDTRMDLTLLDAVDCLLFPDENSQLCGASYIQHSTFTDDNAKKEVLKLKGIPPLVSLMSSPTPQIQQTAASALRNLVFKDQANKDEVQRCGGIAQAVQLLKDTDSAETQKHVTGLLWNLSSADNLKVELLRSALPVLTQTILQPFSDSTNYNANTNLDAESFYNATGCLRNLSSGKQSSRQALRNCNGLVDSLVSYVRNCVEAGTPDDKSVENCVCILHNLTYQLESEAPAVFSKINAFAKSRTNTSDPGPIGCFSSQSRKIQQEYKFDFPVAEENNPKGQSWLIHSRTLQTYLNLLSSSENTAMQEACCGALNNLTANKGIVSDMISHTIVQKLNGLHHLTPLLQSSNPSVKNSVTSLVGNLSRSPNLQNVMARQALPRLVQTLNSGITQETDFSPESDSTIATACHTVNNLLRAEPDMAKQFLNNSLINSLNDMSQNISMPKASKAAGVLLHSLWSERNIQSFLKKQGMNKKSFVNDITSAAIKSFQIIE